MLFERAAGSAARLAEQGQEQMQRSGLLCAHADGNVPRSIEGTRDRIALVLRGRTRGSEQTLNGQLAVRQEVAGGAGFRSDRGEQVRARGCLLAAVCELLGQIAECGKLALRRHQLSQWHGLLFDRRSVQPCAFS
jgi:hypothetical protein